MQKLKASQGGSKNLERIYLKEATHLKFSISFGPGPCYYGCLALHYCSVKMNEAKSI